jgi:large subunit ribosomal protein L10
VFKAGVVEGRVVSMAELMAISSLPPLADLQAKILFLINSPAQRVASVLAGVARNLAVVIQQGVKEKKFKEST